MGRWPWLVPVLLGLGAAMCRLERGDTDSAPKNSTLSLASAGRSPTAAASQQVEAITGQAATRGRLVAVTEDLAEQVNVAVQSKQAFVRYLACEPKSDLKCQSLYADALNDALAEKVDTWVAAHVVDLLDAVKREGPDRLQGAIDRACRSSSTEDDVNCVVGLRLSHTAPGLRSLPLSREALDSLPLHSVPAAQLILEHEARAPSGFGEQQIESTALASTQDPRVRAAALETLAVVAPKRFCALAARLGEDEDPGVTHGLSLAPLLCRKHGG